MNPAPVFPWKGNLLNRRIKQIIKNAANPSSTTTSEFHFPTPSGTNHAGSLANSTERLISR